MSFSIDPTVSDKANFRIFIDGNKVLTVEDRRKKPGGHVSSRVSRKLSWWNDTGGECTLTFVELLDEQDPATNPAAWPFEDPLNAGANRQRLPAAPTPDQNPWKAVLAARRDEVIAYKYDIHVVMPDKREYFLDPTIIVRPVRS